VTLSKTVSGPVKDAVPTISEPVKKVIDDVISSVQGDPTVALLEKIEECAPIKNKSVTGWAARCVLGSERQTSGRRR
jgi:hypothetical protein